ncbi:MAG: ABC transporter ATP-binding protein [Clostridiales bacterium]|nr:ABC transporter ATP-binding protein [Clostridiales bacterium]
MITVKNLTKIFGGFIALDGLNLHVERGHVYGLVGVNGSGKTTIIKHLTGIYRQDDGDALINGKPVFDNVDIKKRIGYIPDDLYFFPSYSIDMLAKLYSNMYAAWNGARYKELLGAFGLAGNRKLNMLSKGMQKQAMFSLILAITPEVIILDEPIDGLDPIVRRLVMSVIMEDVEARGMTALISSHNLKEMEGVCDSVGIMKKGRMVIEQGLDDLKTDVHKVQLAYAEAGSREELLSKLDGVKILRQETTGSVSQMIIRGKQEDVVAKLRQTNPLVMDILPLTLEEIFVYETETGGEAND